MATRRLNRPRKISKWQFCAKHGPWFEGNTRYRIAECLVEGGPGGMTPGCEGGKCRLWPGRDFYVEEICHGELLDEDMDWTRESAS